MTNDVSEVAVSRVVMVSAPNSVPRLFAEFIKFIGLRGKASDVFMSNVKALSGREPEAFVVSDQMRLISSPTLLLHAPDDKEVPFSESQSIAASNDHVVLKEIPGKGHRRIIWSADTISEAVEFVVAH